MRRERMRKIGRKGVTHSEGMRRERKKGKKEEAVTHGEGVRQGMKGIPSQCTKGRRTKSDLLMHPIRND